MTSCLGTIPPPLLRCALRSLVFLVFLAPAFGAELELRYAALERILGDQLFTQDGRHYVRGSQTTKCQYAYLESPRVGAENGLLRVAARFSGRSALDVFGRCMGLGDSFDLTLTAAPVVRNGALAFSGVNIITNRDSYYIRRVREALARSFNKDVKLEVRDQAKRLLEQAKAQGVAKAPYQEELADFNLSGVRVTPDSLVLVVEFRLVIR